MGKIFSKDVAGIILMNIILQVSINIFDATLGHYLIRAFDIKEAYVGSFFTLCGLSFLIGVFLFNFLCYMMPFVSNETWMIIGMMLSSLGYAFLGSNLFYMRFENIYLTLLGTILVGLFEALVVVPFIPVIIKKI
jgi:Na+/melibiose symporter-like transporter